MATILVIEDNSANLDLMVYLLEAFGHQTISAPDGDIGLRYAQSKHPDAIICDIQLPKTDGYVVAHELKLRQPLASIPLIAVTAFAMASDREHVLAAGFDGYISKPIDPELFVGQVERFLAPRQRMPLLPPPARAVQQAQVGASAAYHATVLLVDDTDINLQLMSSMLEPLGYRTIAARHVDQAYALASAHMPDLVISDLHMPYRSGFDLITAFKSDSLLRHIHIIIHSATICSESERREALRLGASQCILRPIEPHILLDAIGACLRGERER